jgi:rhodanese-related sulfurtransferase
MTSVAPEELVELLQAGGELAVLDAREQGVFFHDHLFWSSCVPLSRLELLVADLVPRRDTPVVWCDEAGASGGVAVRAAERLLALGWHDVRVLAGGMAAWPGERYSGVNVPSKAFGEWVETRFGTPHLPAVELRARLDRGDPVVVLDSRPPREFRRMSIPGALDCPGAELVYRVHELAPDAATTVVVNCAGRTRSIIGAQSLRNAGLPNPVFALEHGTMGWELAGFELANGETGEAPLPSPTGLARAVEASRSVAERFAVGKVSWSDVSGWLADPTRTTYLLDVRTDEEYEAGHVAGSRHAPGGQLVQAADEYVATLGARLVLIDEGSGVRATMTASWLVQFDRYEVVVLDGGTDGLRDSGVALERGVRPATVLGTTGIGSVPGVSPQELPPGATIIDLADSLRYRRGHLPGAWWAVRSRLDDARDAIGPCDEVVLTSPDGVLAALAHEDATALWPSARVLAGGSAAWPGGLETGFERPTTAPDDVWYKPYDAEDEAVARQAMRDYLTWEVALADQIARDPLVRFGVDPPNGSAALTSESDRPATG